jgi:hypothetical protein
VVVSDLLALVLLALPLNIGRGNQGALSRAVAAVVAGGAIEGEYRRIE